MSFFDYFQLVFLALFLMSFVGRTVHQRFVTKTKTIALGRGKRGIGRILELLLLPGVALWMVKIVLDALQVEFFRWWNPVLLDWAPARWLGVLLILVGFAAFIWALASFGTSWRIGIDTKTPGELVTGGAFAFSRNPTFLFLDLYFLGTFLINGALGYLVAFVIMATAIHFQILKEEAFLERQYGGAYSDYRARTGRYITLRRRLAKHRTDG